MPLHHIMRSVFLTFTLLEALVSAQTRVTPSHQGNSVVISQEKLQKLLPQNSEWNSTASYNDFVVDESHPFVTPAEASNFTETATYEEITTFFMDLARRNRHVQIKSIAKLSTGEDLWMVTVSGERKFEPDEMNEPVVLVTAGMRGDESSGVNAGMMFIRNLVSNPENRLVLRYINFIFIPVMNVQGYLRQSPNGRITQFGPNTAGRRVTNSNRDLYRDFAKVETPEVQAVVKIMRNYDISFYMDLQSSDSVNFQPDVTWCDNGDAGLSNSIFAWLRGVMLPNLTDYLESYNHFPGPCALVNDPIDPTSGYYPFLSDGPTYSANYADHIQIPAYLLQVHALKPFNQRMLGAYAFIKGIVDIVVAEKESLRQAITEDREARVGT
eukprot:scaffold5899_cov167-Amphora_coffeaeformis.AAC.5